jgi:RNA polymerase sigma-70 factor (ECF subfamily)
MTSSVVRPAGRQYVEQSTSEPVAALIALARQGDVTAFASLVNAYYPRCLRFARNMLGDPQDAEEAVQDTWVRVYDALGRFRDDEKFEPWLFRILGNRCRTSYGRRRRREELVTYEEAPEDRGVAAPSDDASLWRDELQRAIAMLPDEQREAFLMRHVEGLGYEDMAAATGAGVSALKMRVKRACDFLRVQLEEVERA